MSWDLHPEEMIDKASSLPVTQTPEVGVFHNFMEGAAKAAMQGFAKTARAVDLLGAVGPIVEDWATDVQNRRALGSVPATMPKTVTAQDRYFKEHDAMFQSAVDYWTPRPNEVGVAGEVAGSLLNMLPTIMASPALAVGATQLAQGQDLVREGVDPGKAQAVGAVQALGLGAGIWMPILGTNALQRIVIGGAGFNVVQGVATRAASKAILEGDKAAEQFRPLGGTELTLDILLGLAFGTMAHINPAQRAQGAKAWEDIGDWLKDAPPSDKAALATLREAQHINLDSLPGTPQTAADLDVHVQRMRAAIESLATDKPVDIENIVKDQASQPTMPEVPDGMVRVYRGESAAKGEIPEWVMQGLKDNGSLDAQGRWWTPDPEIAKWYKEDAGEAGRVVWQDVPAEVAAQAKVSTMDESIKRFSLDPENELFLPPEYAGKGNPMEPRYNPDMARIEQDTAIREAIQEHAKTVAAEEGIPQIPDRKTIAQTIEEQLVQAGRPAEEAKAGATLWQAFFDTTASRYGRTGQELFDRYMKGITGQAGEGPMLEQRRTASEILKADEARVMEKHGAYKTKDHPRGEMDVDIAEKLAKAGDPDAGPAAMLAYLEGDFSTLSRDTKLKNPATKALVEYVRNLPKDDTGPLYRVLAWETEAQRAAFLKKIQKGADTALQQERPIMSFTTDSPEGKTPMNHIGLDLASQFGEHTVVLKVLPPAGSKTMRIGADISAAYGTGAGKGLDVVVPRDQQYKVIGSHDDGNTKVVTLEALENRVDAAKLFQGAVPWYHSELERQIGTAKMGAASPKDWKNFIKGLSNKGVKADEVKWTGLEEWLDLQQGKVTKEQIQQYMKDGGVKVEETTLGEGSTPVELKWEPQTDNLIAAELPNGNSVTIFFDNENRSSGATLQILTPDATDVGAPKDYQTIEAAQQAAMDMVNERKQTGDAKFGQWQLPGGENYRELLLTLPENGKPATLPEGYSLQEMARGDYTLVGPDGSGSILSGTLGASESYRTNAAIEMLRRKGVLPPEPTPFRSSHFDQPNILAHIRFNERTDADGKKVLFIEEIQSDWAQKGKKEGFADPNKKRVAVKESTGDQRTVARFDSDAEAQAYIVEQGRSDLHKWILPKDDGPPSAPFVGKTEAWVGLSLKRMIRYAAENGFDRVAWTNGEQQAARYDLSKQVKEIVYQKDPSNPGWFLVEVWSNDGKKIVNDAYQADKLVDVVGKEVVAKMEKDEGVNRRDRTAEPGYENMKVLSGLDLKVGGEGMKAFYDKIVPNVANDVLRKLGGGRVGEVAITERDPDGYRLEPDMNPETGEIIDRGVSQAHKVPGFDITPSMREKAMETQALFQPDRGALQFDQQGKMAIALLKSADPSTFLHESGHFFLEVTNDLASQPDAPAAMKQDMQTLYSWFGLKDADTWNNMTLDEKRPYHEQFARGFERYLRDGQAPTPVLKGLFQRFRDWLKAVYQSASQLNVEVSDQVRAVMDRMLAEPQRTEAPPEATRSATPPPPRGGVGEPMGEASVLTEVQQVREDIMAAEHTARQRWGDAIVDALYEKYAPHLEDAGQLRGMSAIMESLAEDAKPAYLMKTMGPRPKEPQSLIAAIKELGGINTSMRSDIAGPDKKGVPVSLFRKAGKNVDELALLLQEKGFLNEADIANESDNGGINKLMEMIQDEIAGNKHYSERDATQAAALREHDQFMESIDGKGESASTHFTPEEWATIQREVIAEGLAPTAKNVVDADAVHIAMQIDEARVERAAITAADDHDFMAEVREIIDGYKPQPDATAAERGTPTAAEPGTPGPAGQEANAPGADRNAGNQGVIAQQALRMVAENPDLPIATGVDAQGNTTYQKASEYLAEAKAMADLKRQDASLFELAAQCLLGGGR